MKKYYIVVLTISSFFLLSAGIIDLSTLFNYSNQAIPNYISEDNTPASNPITDEGATLGRVLFYDKNLSLTGTTACASCHKQELAFGDDAIQSPGHDGGLTGRHSPRLASARFGEEEKFFWDERALSLEAQSTMPLQDHIEMGFSGEDGDPDIDSLISRLDNISYYQELFNLAFGDQTITEDRMQKALAQFVRSMQSFDSRYDIGRAQVGNDNVNFPNFTTVENNGKALYMSGTATGCNGCHRAPAFDIDPNSGNNGVIGVAGLPGSTDLTNERSPSLRDIVNANGTENGPYMHDGSLATLTDVINHYDEIPNNNADLDNRLRGNGGNLNLSTTEKAELLAFLNTLGGSNIYSDERWSNPFDDAGDLEILNGTLPVELAYFEAYDNSNNVILEWQTAVEINNSGFEILHSSNTQDWQVVDFVEGENRPADYAYTHFDPFAGNNYYRLKQIDYDGAFALSLIKSVRIEASKEELFIYPNPTADFVNIRNSDAFDIASIYDQQGQLVKQLRIDAFGTLDLTDLDAGAYIMRVSSENSNQYTTTKVLKI